MRGFAPLVAFCAIAFARLDSRGSNEVDHTTSYQPAEALQPLLGLEYKVAASCSCPKPNCTGGAVAKCTCLKRADAECRKQCPSTNVEQRLCDDGKMPLKKRASPPPPPTLPPCSGICPKSTAIEHTALAVPAARTLDDRPHASAAVACGGKGSCPGNQACVTKRNVLTGASAGGQCVGQTCFLAPRDSDKKVRCPAGQICVAKPRREGGHITDVPGLCADRGMRCKVAQGCGQMGPDWVCQNRPNGDGPLCEGAGCGLCIHFGDRASN